MHRRPRIRFLALAALGGLGWGALGTTARMAAADHDEDARGFGVRRAAGLEIPDVAGRSPEDARRRLEALGLSVRLETAAHDDVGRALNTYPAAGSWRRAGDEVALRVGVAPRVMTVVPDLGRQPAAVALAGLDEVYCLEVLYVRGAPRHEGRIRRQLPDAGTLLPFRGLLVVEVVRNHAEVPYVEGLPLRVAREVIEAAGLTFDVHVDVRADVRRGTVLDQSPAAGVLVPFDSMVHLAVASRVGGMPRRGPGTHALPSTGSWFDAWGDLEDDRIVAPAPPPRLAVVIMPNVRGMRRDDAEAHLNALGLPVEPAEGRGRRFEVVTQQSPVAGTRIPVGTRIVLESAYGRPVVPGGPGPR